MQADEESIAQLTAAVVRQAVLDAAQIGYDMGKRHQSDAQQFLDIAGIGEDIRQKILDGMDARGKGKRAEAQAKKEEQLMTIEEHEAELNRMIATRKALQAALDAPAPSVQVEDPALTAELARLNQAIKNLRVQAENATSKTERDRLNAIADRTERFEIPAVRKSYATRAAKAQKEAAALEAAERANADKAIAEWKRDAKIRFLAAGGTSAEWEVAWPNLLTRWKNDRALGKPEPEQPRRRVNL